MNDIAPRVAIFGIGSPHGDDQFGWMVVDQLSGRIGNEVQLRKISSPIDVVESLQDYERVILLDAAVGLPADVAFRKMDLAIAGQRTQLQQMRHAGTHDLGLTEVLKIAQSLKKPIDHIEIWVGNGQQFHQLANATPAVEQAAHQCASIIEEEMTRRGCCDARNVVG